MGCCDYFKPCICAHSIYLFFHCMQWLILMWMIVDISPMKTGYFSNKCRTIIHYDLITTPSWVASQYILQVFQYDEASNIFVITFIYLSGILADKLRRHINYERGIYEANIFVDVTSIPKAITL